MKIKNTRETQFVLPRFILEEPMSLLSFHKGRSLLTLSCDPQINLEPSDPLRIEIQSPKDTPQNIEPLASFYNSVSQKQEQRKHDNNTKKEYLSNTLYKMTISIQIRCFDLSLWMCFTCVLECCSTLEVVGYSRMMVGGIYSLQQSLLEIYKICSFLGCAGPVQCTTGPWTVTSINRIASDPTIRGLTGP